MRRACLAIGSRETMQAVTLDTGEAGVFARAALALNYEGSNKPAPITERQVLMPRRAEDSRADLWSAFNRTQENLIQGGLSGRAGNGRRQSTRAVQGIDSSLRLSRALWVWPRACASSRRDLPGGGSPSILSIPFLLPCFLVFLVSSIGATPHSRTPSRRRVRQ